MNSRAKTSALVLGLIGGSINVFIASLLSIVLIALIPRLTQYSSYYGEYSFYYDPTPQILIYAAIIIVCLLNFIGALTCIRRRIAGGVLMLITGILLLFVVILAFTNTSASAGYMYAGFGSPVIIAFAAIIMIAEVLPIIGAVLCFSPANRYITYGQPYGQPYAQPYGQPQQYRQPYAQPQQPENK